MPKKLFLLFLILAASCGSAFASSVPEDLRCAPIQHNGRIKPFEAFARQTLKLVYGRETWQKTQAAQVLFDNRSNPQAFADFEWIRLDYFELKKDLELPEGRHFFSLNEIEPKISVIERLVRSSKTKRDQDQRPSKLEQKAELLLSQVRTVQSLVTGDFSKALLVPQKKEPRLWLEVWYYRLKPFECAAGFYLLGFLALTLFHRKKLGVWLILVALLFHTLGIALRVYILQRPPVSNMYESMIFMNWALMIYASVFSILRKNSLAIATGSILSALVMIYANLLPIDSSLEVLVPVLRSNYWLTIHVMTIVSSYGAFGLAMALGHRHLFLQALRKMNKASEEESASLIFRVIQWGALLIGTGTFLGGVWANESWGRFWGWDPKETWALITFLGYLIIVHLKYAKKISNFYLALGAVLGFLLVLMTWYGVNFVLGRGLHSYGAGSGGMRWVIYYLIFEAAFVTFVFLKKPKK